MTTGPADVRGMTMPPDPDNGGDIEFDPVWDSRGALTHIHQFARARRVSPYAALGAVLRNAIAAVPPRVVVPPIVGRYAAPNLFTAPCGRSGQGKDAGNGAGDEAVGFYIDDALTRRPAVAYPQLGSGEGLARVFAGSGKGENAVPGAESAQIIVPEIRTLGALAGRSGATIDGEVLKGYMGQAIGFTNAHAETTTAVEAFTYRLCLSVGVQPENIDFFTTREKDGFPQRFLFLPVTDPDAPRFPDPAPEPLKVRVPDFPANDADGRFHVIDIPQVIRDEVDEFRHRVLIEDRDVDPIDGHLMLTRIKIAFALAVLDGRPGIDTDDWRVAGLLMAVSKATYDRTRQALTEKRRRENRARAEDSAERQQIVEDRLTEGRQKRVAQIVIRKLKKVKTATRVELRRAVASVDRGEFDPVFATILDGGVIVCCGTTGGGADEYRIG